MDITALYDLYLRHPNIQTDTRKLRPGDLYVALKGPNFDGNAFAKQALDAGAAAAVVDDASLEVDDRYFLVNDGLDALQTLAKHHRNQLQIPFLAITGSNGKTTTKELITAVLRQKYRTYATEGNLNNHIGVPLTLLKIRQDAEMAVVEMGANHQKEIASYCVIAQPDYGLITNVGKAHIEGFGGEEGVRKGKGELFDFLRDNGGTVFRNIDLDYLKDMASGIQNQVLYGSADAAVTGNILEGKFLQVAIRHNGEEIHLSTQLVGDYNFPNVMAAVAVGIHFGVPIEDIRTAIEGYQPDNSRSQWLERGGNRIVLDAYNANPTSMRAAIRNFAKLEGTDKRLWIGGMKEMGAAEREEHESLVQFIQETGNWHEVILVGKEFENLNGHYPWFATSANAAAFVSNLVPQGATILIKGSRGSKMETLLEALPKD